MRLGLEEEAVRQQAKERFWQDFLAELSEARQCRTTVISSEQLHTRLRRPQEIARLCALLEPKFSEIVIVVYIRRQIDYAVSSYSTLIKSGYTRPELARPEQAYIDYQLLIDRWTKGFPRAHLILRRFDRSQLMQGDIVKDFCSAIGLDSTGYDFPDQQNESLDLLSLELLRRLNLLLPVRDGSGLNPLRSNMIKFFEYPSSGPRKQATAKQIDEYETHFAVSNEWVRARYFPQLETLFPPIAKPLQGTSLSASNTELDQMADLIARIWTRKQGRIRKLQGEQGRELN